MFRAIYRGWVVVFSRKKKRKKKKKRVETATEIRRWCAPSAST